MVKKYIKIMKNKNLNEEVNRIKSLFTEERLYGNLCEQQMSYTWDDGGVKPKDTVQYTNKMRKELGSEEDYEWIKSTQKFFNNIDLFRIISETDFTDPHVFLPIAEMGLWIATPVCPVCPFLATGVGLADAAVYAKEGDYATAGLAAAFSIIPSLPFGKTIPGVKELGKDGMIELSHKVLQASKGVKVEFTAAEKVVVGAIKEPKRLKTINNLVKNEIKKNSAKVVSNPSLLKKIGSGGLKVMKELAKMGTIGGVGYMAGSTYAQSGSAGPLAMLKDKYGEISKEQWGEIKKEFGSTGTKEDNMLMVQAIKSGWEMGKEVPEKFQTKTYKENKNNNQEDEFSEEDFDNILSSLENLGNEE
jgi:hypothetical protein